MADGGGTRIAFELPPAPTEAPARSSQGGPPGPEARVAWRPDCPPVARPDAFLAHILRP